MLALRSPFRIFLVPILLLTVVFLPPSLSSAEITIERVSGRLSVEETDFSLRAGAISIEFGRSLSLDAGIRGLFGSKWMSGWERRLTDIDPILFINEPSGTVSFEKKGHTEFRSAAGEKIILEKDGSKTRLKTDSTSERYSSDGRLLEVRYRNGNVVKLIYDARGRLALINGPRSNTIEIMTDGEGKATRLETSTGTVVLYAYEKDKLKEVQVNGQAVSRFTYDSQGRLESLEKLTTGTTRFTYDEKGRVAARKFSDGSEEKYAYDDTNRKYRYTDPSGGITTTILSEDRRTQEIVDPLGNKSVLLYDSEGRLIKITGPTGSDVEMTYDALGRVVSVKDAVGNITHSEYAGDTSSLKKTKMPDGTEVFYDYDEHRNIRSVKIGERVILSRTYTPDGLVESVKGIGMPERKFTYHPDGRLKSGSNALGEKTLYEYDRSGNLIRETNPLGGVTVRNYDSQHRLIKEIDPAGLTTQYSYDDRGRLETIIHKDGRTTSYKHDALGRILSITLPSGGTISNTYDPAGRILDRSGPGSEKETFKYDLSGNLIEKKDQWGNITKYEYNELGKVIREYLPGGLVNNYRYDKSGNLEAIEDSTGARTEYQYDASGQVAKIIDALGAATEYKYDPAGNPLAVNNSIGKTKVFSYDFYGALASVREPNGDEAKYEYDPAGRLIAGHRPGGGVAQFRYDTAGNLTIEKDPLGNEQNYSYDTAGRLIKKTTASGQSITLSYDRSGRLAEERFPDGRRVKYKYDDRGNKIEAGDDKFPMAYKYDKHGRIAAVAYSALRKAIKYEYDDAGFRSRLVMPDGKDVRYEYDGLKRLSAIVMPGDKKVLFSYDSKGFRDKIVYPNGVTGVFEYDSAGRVAGIAYGAAGAQSLFSERYIYDAAGNVVQRKGKDGRDVLYRYDPSGQLIEESGPESSVQYTYGPGGNRAELKRGDISIKYKYDKADRLIEAGDETISYDADGNLVSRKGSDRRSYAYDAESRLVKAVGPGPGEVFYGYDASGNRVWRRDNKGTVFFIYDGMDLVQDLGVNLDTRATYIFAPGIDRPVAMLRDGKTFYYHADRLGSIRHLTDEQGAIAASYDYDAFGRITKQNAQTPNPFTYTAREFDPSTGLYYYRARYYDPVLGRFFSRDPELPLKTEPISMNPYIYVKNSPVRFTDPLGLSEMPPGVTEQLWLAENYLSGYSDKLARFDAGENVPGINASNRQQLVNAIAEQKGVVEAYRSRFPGIEPQRPSWYVDPPPVQQPAGGTPPGSGTSGGARGSDTMAVRPGGAKGSDTLAVRPGAQGSDTMAVRPGGAKGSDTIAVRPGGAAPGAGGVSGTNVAGGVGGVLGAVGSYVNLQACLDEGHSKAYCTAELGLGIGIGVGVGVLLAPVVAAGGTAATIVIAGGTALAAAGAYVAGNRWSDAPETKATAEQQAAQQGQDEERVRNALANLSGKIDNLRALGKDFCEAQASASKNANEAKAVAEAAKKAVDEALGSMSSEVSDKLIKECTAAQEKLRDLPQKISKAEEWIGKSKQGYEEAISRLSQCFSQQSIADSDKLLEAAVALGLSGERKYKEAEADITALKESIPKINETVGNIKRKMSSLETNFAANMESVDQYFKNTEESAASAAAKLASFNAMKADLLGSASRLEGVIPPSFKWELAAVRGNIDAVTLPCPDKLDEYKGIAKGAKDSIKVAWPKDAGGLGGLLSMAPSAIEKLGIDSALSSCGSLQAPTGDDLNNAALALVKLADKTPDWLKTIADLRAACYAKLYPPKPPSAGQKPPEPPGGQTTQTPPSQPVTPPEEEPPKKPHVLSRFGVSCYPEEIDEEGSATCRAHGEYADNPDVIVELTGVAGWPKGNAVSGKGRGGTTVSITANLEGASDTAIVKITTKTDKECAPGAPYNPKCDPNAPGGKGGKPPVDPNVGAGFQEQQPGGKKPDTAGGGGLGGGQPTQQPTGYTGTGKPEGGEEGETTPPGGTPPPCYDPHTGAQIPCPPEKPLVPTLPPGKESKPGPQKCKPGEHWEPGKGCHKKPGTSSGGSGGQKPPPSKPPTTSTPSGGGGG